MLQDTFGCVSSASKFLKNYTVNVTDEVHGFFTVLIPDVKLTKEAQEKITIFRKLVDDKYTNGKKMFFVFKNNCL